MFILKFKDGTNRIRHHRNTLENLEQDCQFNNILMSDFDLFETEESVIIDTLSDELYLQSDYDNLIETENYKSKLLSRQNEIKKSELIKQINDIEAKLPRAIAEYVLNLDSKIKDKKSNQTWLDYYTEQILALRAEMAGL